MCSSVTHKINGPAVDKIAFAAASRGIVLIFPLLAVWQARIRTAIKGRTARRDYEAVLKGVRNQRLAGTVRPPSVLSSCERFDGTTSTEGLRRQGSKTRNIIVSLHFQVKGERGRGGGHTRGGAFMLSVPNVFYMQGMHGCNRRFFSV